MRAILMQLSKRTVYGSDTVQFNPGDHGLTTTVLCKDRNDNWIYAGMFYSDPVFDGDTATTWKLRFKPAS